MKRFITVIGAGFSGLTTAYFLNKAGLPVRIVEKQSRVGGLLGTHRTEFGLVETAANGLINSARLEAMCADIGVKLQAPKPAGRARFFWRNRPRRWPLTVGESLRLSVRLVQHLRHWRPNTGETLGAWGERVIGSAAVQHALTPAMGGIYASDADMLSASLIFNRKNLGLEHIEPVIPKPSVRGTVSPRNGMQELLDGLQHYLQAHGVAIELNHHGQLEPNTPTVICTSAPQAAGLLAHHVPELSARLGQIELLPIVTATCFYEHSSRQPQGFGCLFPRQDEIRALGVLFNDCLFPERSEVRSETWILGGATDRSAVQLNDADLKTVLQSNHARMVRAEEQLLNCHITRWPQALPHYSLKLEQVLTKLPPLPNHLALVGNYLGKIGLGKLLDRAHYVAAQMKELVRQ
ncbi:MAG: FAD-dependent oxidoreductase [Acidobacteriota bacterium]|nr:FAD-dependent oxidoreductase [Acidobacteriota bacterium]